MLSFNSYKEVREHYKKYDRRFILAYSALIVLAAGLSLYGVFTTNPYHEYIRFIGAALAASTFFAIINPRLGQIAWVLSALLLIVFVRIPETPEMKHMLEVDPDSATDFVAAGVIIGFTLLPIVTFTKCHFRREEDADIAELAERRRDERDATSLGHV